MQGEPKKLEENAKNILESYSTTQKMKFSIKGFFSKCDQIRSFLWICSHLMKKSLMENFIFCAVIHCTATLIRRANEFSFCNKTNGPKSRNTPDTDRHIFQLENKSSHNNLCVFFIISALLLHLRHLLPLHKSLVCSSFILTPRFNVRCSLCLRLFIHLLYV